MHERHGHCRTPARRFVIGYDGQSDGALKGLDVAVYRHPTQ
jgi:hypothetical protein